MVSGNGFETNCGKTQAADIEQLYNDLECTNSGGFIDRVTHCSQHSFHPI